MASDPNKANFTDPHHCPIVHADGPISVSQIGDTIVLSFSQISPKLDTPQVLGKVGEADLEMMVVARVGIPRSKARELLDIFQKMITMMGSSGRA